MNNYALMKFIFYHLLDSSQFNFFLHPFKADDASVQFENSGVCVGCSGCKKEKLTGAGGKKYSIHLIKD